MSTIAERARAEADEAEAENPDAEPVEPIQPDEEEVAEEEQEEAAEPSSLAVIADQEKLLDAESKRHAKALAKALGEHWGGFALCPLCQVDGYAMPYGPGEVGPEQRLAILTVMGEAPGQNLGEHPTEVRCDVCDGYGEMLNGSRRPEQMTSACQTCMGTGHVAKSFPQPQPNGQPPAIAWSPPPPTFTPDAINSDAWGRPFGNPNWGVDPRTNGGEW